jgi:ribonucleoside-diphosphate reductase alpha chain
MNSAVQKLLKERYYLPNENTWEQLAERVSVIYPPIKESIINKTFIPSSPTLMNANTKGQRIGTLSSCFPMNIEDSVDGIYDSLKECAIVTKYGGGIGIDFGNLRSSTEIINSLGRKSSGPIPFMKNFDVMLDGIQQGGVR